MEKAIERLRRGKTAGKDELENEVWKYGGEGLREKVWEVCKNGMGRSRMARNMLLIVPLKKKEERKKVEEYKGVTLLNSMYKVRSEKKTRDRDGGKRDAAR